MAKELESHLVRLTMPNASAEEIAEATKRWFNFLLILDRIADRLERQSADSRDMTSNDRVGA